MSLSRFLLVSSLFALGGCSYMTDGSIQDITVVTPGAHGAVCYVYVEDLRYKVNPPGTINIAKSQEDLVVDCLAPGNRRRQVYIKAGQADSFSGNIIGGTIPGGIWDYASNAMFQYPSVVEVNFVGISTKPEELPAQNNPDIKQPEEYYLEEFSPGTPRLNDDRDILPTEIRRRERSGGGASLGSGYARSGEEPISDADFGYGAPSAGGKGDLMDVIDALGDTMNPAETSSDMPSTPQYPGE